MCTSLVRYSIGVGRMSHHKQIIIDGINYGHLRITNAGQVLSIVIHQPWGDLELFKSKYEDVDYGREEE